MLAWPIYVSFLGAAIALLCGGARRDAVRWIALGSAGVNLLIALAAAENWSASGGLQTLVNVPWIASLGIDYHLAADGVSLVLVLLTAVASFAGILFSWNVDKRVNEFFALYLALVGGVYGVFLSFDLFLLFVFYEIAIVPKYFLIAIWGSTRRNYAAMKLVIYSFVGSALTLVGILALYVAGGGTTDLQTLSETTFEPGFQRWVFPLVFVGFAVLAGMWPFHSWAPTGHSAAPTGASMLLAGVVMKMGAYGAFRVGMGILPEGFMEWRTWIAALATIGIVYGACVALTQKDFKFVIGYSSVSHMGFVLLGLATLNTVGLSGAVLQMFSHGVIAGLLFGVVGRMVYDRAHTRDLGELSAFALKSSLPFAAVTFVLAGAASIGIPGFSGFIAEIAVIIGAWKAFPFMACVAGAGILIGVVYTMKAMQKAFFADASKSDPVPAELPPITIAEKVGTGLLLFSTVLIGLWPGLLLDLIIPALEGDFFAALMKGGAQ